MKRQIQIVIPVVLLATMLGVIPAQAQRGFGGRPAPSHGGWRGFTAQRNFAPSRGARAGFGFRRSGWGYGSGWAYLPFPDDYGQGDNFAPTDYEPQMAPPAPVVFEPPEPPKVIQPILIERQGDDWVQVAGYKQATVSGRTNPMKADERENSSGLSKPLAPVALPPAVLVFRDGHQEEVKGYTIIGSTIYAKSDYWSTGTWTRKVQLADLNVPATLKANQENGSPLRLPSGPQEIIIRP